MKASLYWRVIGNFSILLLVLTAVTLLTLNILSQIEKQFANAASDSGQILQLEQLNTYISQMPPVTNEYMYTGNDSIREVYDNAWKDFDGIVADLQRTVSDTSRSHTLQIIRDNFYQWIAEVGERRMLLRERYAKGEQVQHYLDSIARHNSRTHYLANARNALHEYIGNIVLQQPATIALAKNLASDLEKYIITVNLLLAVFALVLGFVLTKSITNPIQKLKEGTKGIMEGNFTPIELNRKDELGDLAKDFNHMSVMLGNNYNRLKAYSELVTMLNSQESIKDIETKSLDLLCEHSNSAIGALYLYDDEEGHLTLVAGHGLKNGSAVKRFKSGEGLPGQCLKERKTIEWSNISVDAGLTVDTGLVEVVPRQVIASPIFLQDNVLGILILGSLSQFSDLDKEIITHSLPQLGVAIANAQNYDETQKLSREVSEKNKELNGKNAELEKAYKVKSEFLASMSHELRTPLNSIIGFSSVLLGPIGDPLTADQRKGLEKVLKNGKHLLQLINDVLDFSKLESGRMTVNVETEDVENIVSTSIATIETMAKSKSLEVAHHIADGLPLLNTDVLKIKQIIVNLLSNAVKFTEKGEVAVTVTQSGEFVQFSVKDSGIGIEEKNYDKVFEEFQQIDNSNTRKYKGTGLGLSISKKFARLLGGDLTFQSKYGEGTTFTLKVPPTYTSSEQSPPPKKASIPVVEPATTPAPSTVSSVAAESGGPKKIENGSSSLSARGVQVLCIDDDPEVIEILRSYLVPEGFSVIEANSGNEGIAKAEQYNPSAITLDIMMPQKDGWQVLRELKQNPRTKHIPVVIHSIIENRPLAISLGAVDVVTKPTDSEKLLSLIRREYNARQRYILVVDDDEDFTLAMQKILEADGYRVKIANSGVQALAQIKESVPDVVFCDLTMPEMDGFELVRRLRAEKKWSAIPVVILSGKELSDDEWSGLRKQISEYVKKSEFTPESLTGAVKRILS